MQPTIQFHILESANQMQALHYACLQIEKLYQAEQTIYIHTETLTDAERLDTLLWTYREDSFLPHQVLPIANAVPIVIGYKDMPSNDSSDILINLSQHIPANYQKFNQMIEIVFPEPSMQQLARERFKHYRDQGHELQTIKMKTL